jgi:hypothetical protein
VFEQFQSQQHTHRNGGGDRGENVGENAW